MCSTTGEKSEVAAAKSETVDIVEKEFTSQQRALIVCMMEGETSFVSFSYTENARARNCTHKKMSQKVALKCIRVKIENFIRTVWI